MARKPKQVKAHILENIGKTFGHYQVLEYSKSAYSGHYFKCKCECGKIKDVLLWHLKSGNIKSCGCKKIGRLTHGYRHTPEYAAWCSMKSRCYSKTDSSYKNYGGRGITVCDEWRYDFMQFLCDMGNRPSEFHSLDRKDPNGNYKLDNCHWVTRKEQNNNKRTTLWVKFQGARMSVAEYAERNNIPYGKARRQYYKQMLLI